ncbi:MAG: hypothetical protein ACI4KR_02420 [Ruminiclostridium sp.]
MKAMTKSTITGEYAEHAIIPYTENQRRYWSSGKRGVKKLHSSPQQQKANDKNAKRHFKQLINGNFSEGDYFVTCTYEGAEPTIQEVKADISRFCLRLKYQYKKIGAEFKYIAVIESGGKCKRLHFHLIISGGASPDDISKLWKKGVCDVRRLTRKNGKDFNDLCSYLTKQRLINVKRWSGSQNLKQPTITREYITISKSIYLALLSAVICKEYNEIAALLGKFFGKAPALINCSAAENPALQAHNIYLNMWNAKAPLYGGNPLTAFI